MLRVKSSEKELFTLILIISDTKPSVSKQNILYTAGLRLIDAINF